MTLNKIEITQQILSILHLDLAREKAFWLWFVDGRKNSSNLRLTKQGYEAFVVAKYPFYDIPLATPLVIPHLPSYFFLRLQNRFHQPWFITPTHIYVSDSSDAAWLTLFGESLDLLTC